MNGDSELAKRLLFLRARLSAACQRAGRPPEEVTLVAVSKGFPASAIVEAHMLGIRNFGENRVQEAQSKFAALPALFPKPVYHLIGHLQSNKVKPALQLFDIIQSVDSLKLADLLNSQAAGYRSQASRGYSTNSGATRPGEGLSALADGSLSGQAGRKVPVFLEINTSGEKTKFGFKPGEAADAFEHICKLHNPEIRGLMTVAPVVSKPEEARPYFRLLRELAGSLGLKELSMGMSDDYEVAVEEGATMIRIGRALFGERREE